MVFPSLSFIKYVAFTPSSHRTGGKYSNPSLTADRRRELCSAVVEAVVVGVETTTTASVVFLGDNNCCCCLVVVLSSSTMYRGWIKSTAFREAWLRCEKKLRRGASISKSSQRCELNSTPKQMEEKAGQTVLLFIVCVFCWSTFFLVEGKGNGFVGEEREREREI